MYLAEGKKMNKQRRFQVSVSVFICLFFGMPSAANQSLGFY
jgi:hypothetical protein